tara:strand:- start:662 stop:1546 length:885 start_codon:yes stop_codon:yes gene_type:complete
VKILARYEELQTIYAEIIEGYSYCHRLKAYVKHFNDIDYANVYKIRDVYMREEVGDGILSEAERLKIIMKDDLWTEQDEDDLVSLKWLINDNTKQIETIVSPDQRKTIQKMVDEKKIELDDMSNKRASYLHPTKEYYSSKYLSEILPYHSLFKDKDLSIPRYEQGEYDEFSEEEITEIAIHYAVSLGRFSARNFRLLAGMPFVLNQLSLARKNPLVFLNKPIVYLTSLQLDIYNKVMRNLDVLENSEGRPPEFDSSTEDQEILDWYDVNYSVWQGKNSKGGDSEIRKTTNYVNS